MIRESDMQYFVANKVAALETIQFLSQYLIVVGTEAVVTDDGREVPLKQPSMGLSAGDSVCYFEKRGNELVLHSLEICYFT